MDHVTRPLRTCLVGLGTIGAVHLEVLTAAHGTALVRVVDPVRREARTRDGARHDVPRTAGLAEALAADPDLDLVVVATPTDSHLDLVGEALEHSGATVLSEKPLTRDRGALASFEERFADRLHRVRVVNHFAWSPEVDWAVRAVASRGWGTPTLALATFTDPYLRKDPSDRATYVSSWVDSGSNQLGLLARFAGGFVLTGHSADAVGTRSVTEVSYEGGRAVLVSSWWTGDSSKQTSLRWDDGREVLLDHTAMTGYLLERGRLVEHFGHDGRTDRKTAHYTRMYAALLAGRADDLLGLPLARSVAALLDEAAEAPAAAQDVCWSATGSRHVEG